MKWYKDNLKASDMTVSEISYLLNICTKVPAALEQVLVNIKSDKLRWVVNTNDGRVKLSSIGDAFVSSKLPKENK